jgi:hypothetical protein
MELQEEQRALESQDGDLIFCRGQGCLQTETLHRDEGGLSQTEECNTVVKGQAMMMMICG